MGGRRRGATFELRKQWAALSSSLSSSGYANPNRERGGQADGYAQASTGAAEVRRGTFLDQIGVRLVRWKKFHRNRPFRTVLIYQKLNNVFVITTNNDFFFFNCDARFIVANRMNVHTKMMIFNKNLFSIFQKWHL